MFNVGPLEMLVIATVGFVLLGPERLPDLARKAVQILRTVQDLATDTRRQFASELDGTLDGVGDLVRSPRSAILNALSTDPAAEQKG